MQKLAARSAIAVRVAIGAPMPSATLFEGTPGNKVDLASKLKGRTLLLVGEPGAFTPG